MDQNMKGATVEECLKNVWRMPKIWQNLKNISDSVTQWLSNMDPRDASASKKGGLGELGLSKNKISRAPT